LFRQEVVAHQQSQWLGTVLIAPRISHGLFAGFAALVTIGVVCLLFFGDYTRKARVTGWLMPELGLMRVLAPQPGVVAQVHVAEGAEVKKGTPMVLLSTELQSEALGSTRQEIVRRLQSRRDSMVAERSRREQLFDEKREDLFRRLEALGVERQQLQREIELQGERTAFAEANAARQRQLRARGITPERSLQQAEEDRLEQAVRLQTLERSRAGIERQRLSIEAELRELPLKHQSELAQIDRETAALEQEIAEAEARREILITAPQDGIVTAIQAQPGGSATPTVPLLSIVPAGSDLQAQLFSPSRAIGFVRPGHEVMLRYEAFPYQKFGSYRGVVANVSRTAISPSELPPQLSGLSGTGEPVYRITVDLSSQTASAYGEPVSLQPGMQLEADVLIERRRLIEWVLDPLYTLTRK